jgi:hypothetical protein
MQRRLVRRAGLVAGLLATLAGGLAVAAGPAGSQSSTCTGSSFVLSQGVGVLNDRTATIFSFVAYDWVTSRTYAVPTIPAGTYELDARSYDGYTARASSPAQPFEMWKVEFLAADNRVLATSGTTGDIPDGVQEAWWVGSVGSITLTEPATGIRVVHAYLANDASPNSVNPICIGGTLQVPPTVPPTTAPPTTIPPTTTPPPTAPPTTPTTSSIPVEVLPEVLPGVPGTPPALPQVREPSYTG